MQCPYCGEDMEYLGVIDGGGDYGDSLCDEWKCLNCGWYEESNCFEFQEIYDDRQDFEDFNPPEDDSNHPVSSGDIPF